MPKPLRALLATVLASFALAFPAAANTSATPDYSDVWYNSAESGWGVNIAQNNGVIFLSLYTYGADNMPRWYFASGMTTTNGTTFTGDFFRTQGTVFSQPWNPGQFAVTPVGTATLNFTSPSTATFNYTVDGVSVTKSIARFTLANDNLSGVYLGGMVGNVSGCSVASNAYLIANRLTVSHTTNTPRFIVDMSFPSGTATCVFQGVYVQTGRTGSIPSGGWACSGALNNSGTFSMTEIQVSQSGLNAKFQGRDQYCSSITGFFGGLRDVQ